MNFRKLAFTLSGLLCLLSLQAQAQSDSATYEIDQDGSILRVYVGRAGVLARMGHNHVVVSSDLQGEIQLAANPVESTASFSFPVASFVVDDPDERARAGDGFDTQPGESAIEGTRANMLGEDVLNAELFPTISATITTAAIEDAQWSFNVTLDIQDNTVELELPGEVTIAESEIILDTRFTLSHEDLGLSPFSALGGSLRVAEEIDFALTIRGIRTP